MAIGGIAAALIVIALLLAGVLGGPPTPAYQVRVSMPPHQCWSGTVTTGFSVSTNEGCGTKTIAVGDSCGVTIVAVMEKGIDGVTLEPYDGTLTVDILKHGSVVRTGSAVSVDDTVAVTYFCAGFP